MSNSNQLFAAVESQLEDVSSAPVGNTVGEMEKWLQMQHLTEDLKAKRAYNTAREKYAHRTFVLVCIWLAIMLIFILFQGFSLQFELSEPVMIAFITTTTANIVFYFTIVLKNLFPHKAE
jgi:uncharacterized membrane protein (DUF485 family)